MSTSQLFQPRPEAVSRAELGIAPDERVVLFVGRIDPIKGIDTLIDAAEIMLSTSFDPTRRSSSSVAISMPMAPQSVHSRTLPNQSHSAASRPVSASSARNRKTSYRSFMARPTSSPCHLATSPSGW